MRTLALLWGFLGWMGSLAQPLVVVGSGSTANLPYATALMKETDPDRLMQMAQKQGYRVLKKDAVIYLLDPSILKSSRCAQDVAVLQFIQGWMVRADRSSEIGFSDLPPRLQERLKRWWHQHNSESPIPAEAVVDVLYGVSLQVYGDGLAQPRSIFVLTELSALTNAGGVSSPLSKTETFLVEDLQTTDSNPASKSDLVLHFSKPISVEQQVSHAMGFYRWVWEELKELEQKRQALETAPLETVVKSWGKSLEQLQKGVPLSDLPPEVQQHVYAQMGTEQKFSGQVRVRLAPSDSGYLINIGVPTGRVVGTGISERPLRVWYGTRLRNL